MNTNEEITIKNVRSKIEEKENQLELYKNKKELALISVLPKASQSKEICVTSSRDTTHDALLEYAAKIEEYDYIIDKIQKELELLLEFETNELKRLSKYNMVEQQVIAYREQGKSWSQIQIEIDKRKLACSLRTARRIWKKYKLGQE